MNLKGIGKYFFTFLVILSLVVPNCFTVVFATGSGTSGSDVINYANFYPTAANGGLIENVSASEPGPVKDSITWKFIKTGSSNQWHGWQSHYAGTFDCNAGEYWTISGFYKTDDAAGIGGFAVGAFSKPGWTGAYDTTIVDSKTEIVADGNWHYFYCTIRANEAMTNAIVWDGPAWGYSTSAGALYINGLQWTKTNYPAPYPGLANYATFNPTTNNGGTIEDVSTSEPGPIGSLKTWKFTKTGTGNQWHGWQNYYAGTFNCNAGDYWRISGFYKTDSDAGIKDLALTGFSKPGWTGKYDTTIVESKTGIVADGKWNYFYITFKANEVMTNAIISNGPSWGYSTSPGVLYINGLQWTKLPNLSEEIIPEASDTFTPRYMLGAVELGGKVYAIGGRTSTKLYNTIEEYNPATKTWARKAAMPGARSGIGVAAVDGKIYAIGGYDGTQYVGTVQAYDPVTNTWETKASMPTARHDFAVAVANGKIYAIGGHNNRDMNEVEEYDPVLDKWDTKASLPTAREGLKAAVVDGKIYTFGGCMYNQGNKIVNYTEEFDPVANTWGTKANMPEGKHVFDVATMDGKIYVIGGYSENGISNKVFEYDPVLNTFKQEKDTGGLRGYFAAACANNKIYLMGGMDANNNLLGTIEEYTPENPFKMVERSWIGVGAVDGKIYTAGGWLASTNKNLDTIEQYDPVKREWVRKHAMPTARRGAGVAGVNGKIYVIGGFDGSKCVNTVEEYDPMTGTWATKASMPSARYDLGVAVVNGKIYAISGYNAPEVGAVEEYDPATDTWTSKASIPTARQGLGTAVVDGKIYAFGGYSYALGGAVASVEEYNPATNTWAKKADMPEAKFGFNAGVINGKIYALGGISSNGVTGTVYQYDPVLDTHTQVQDLNMARARFGAVSMDDKIYIVGGGDDQTLFNTIEEYKLEEAAGGTGDSTIKAYPGCTKVKVVWDEVPGASAYDLEIDGSITRVSEGMSYLHEGLVPGTSHTYRARGVNHAGEAQAWSDTITTTTVTPTQVSTTINAQVGKEEGIVLRTSMVDDLSVFKFTVTYNPQEIAAKDLCAFTRGLDTTIGDIQGYPMVVHEYQPGTIVFSVENPSLFGKRWFGLANIIRFEPLVDGPSTISYRID